jgi:hypothetical protein
VTGGGGRRRAVPGPVLTLSISGEEGALGTIYRGLVFTNTGGRTCTIQGFPGMSFVAGDDGHQVGKAAAWDGAKGGVLTLKPGEAATAPVGFTNIDAYDPANCRPTPVRGLRVYPAPAENVIRAGRAAPARIAPNSPGITWQGGTGWRTGLLHQVESVVWAVVQGCGCSSPGR